MSRLNITVENIFLVNLLLSYDDHDNGKLNPRTKYLKEIGDVDILFELTNHNRYFQEVQGMISWHYILYFVHQSFFFLFFLLGRCYQYNR